MKLILLGLVISAFLFISCNVHNYKVTMPDLHPSCNRLAEYYCAEACFTLKSAFFVGEIEWNTRTNEFTCHCKKRTRNDWYWEGKGL